MRGRPAQEVGEAILADVERFCAGEPAQDDRTVLIIRLPEAGS